MKNLKKRSEVKAESPIEEILIREFRLLDLSPALQFPIGPYRADLCFPEEMVVIECDGQEWHSTTEQIEHDRKRDEYMKNLGWKVYRYTGSNIYWFADQIVAELSDRKEVRPIAISKSKKVAIDYENDLPEEIEYKEETNRMLEESDCADDVENNNTEKLSDIIKRRYAHGF